MRAPDVAMISPYPLLRTAQQDRSGVAGYTARLAKVLSGSGLAVRIVAPFAKGERAIDRDGDVLVERAFARGPGALPRAAHVARASGARVVHLQHEVFLFGGPSSVFGLVPAMAALRRSGVGPVVTLHQVVDPASVDREFTRLHGVRIPPSVALAGLSAVQRSLRCLAQATVVHDQSFQRWVPEAHVVRHGVDECDECDVDYPAEAKARLDLDRSRITALCFGYLAPYKGLEVALEAAVLARSDVQLVVAGGDHPRLAGASGYGSQLRRRYGSVARFLGYVPEPDVAGLFAATDVLLLPYPRPFATSGPYAIALGYGTPVLCSPELATCLGAPAEMVVSSEPVALARRLTELARDRERLQPLRTLSRSLAKGRSWNHIAQQYIAIYEEVTRANRTPARSVRARQSGRRGNPPSVHRDALRLGPQCEHQ